ncbi:type II CAAX endopeptidase family protein [Ruminococcus sp. Marseille-P6503]|uniref:CPBP family intramembrane glutamic endopeptidase n=1 Tax=Ruminococcus sp. Marseille-P6503 TaxID=2364796 RepID=UPI000F54A25E|nr:type II CAAX endopeptidase family protein [Ruminococcus sp. Marseille-P6503]
MFYGNFGGTNFQSDYYNQLIEARRREKKAMFVNCSKLGIILIVYNLLNSLFLNVYYLIVYAYKNGRIVLSVAAAKEYLAQQRELISSSVFSMAGNLFIIFSSLAVILIIARFVMKIDFSEMMKPKKEHTAQAAKWFPLCLTLNVLVSIIIAYFTFYMGQMGITVPESDLSIRQPSAAAVILQIAYVIILGPVAEEIIYRGIILTLLKPFGKFMAVFFSALIFGLMHGNIPQAASAFASALIFGAVAIQCNSIIPTIIIHIVNNIFASFMDFADVYGWAYAQEIYMAFEILVIFMGVYVLFTSGWRLKFNNDRAYAMTSSQRYGAVFSNVFILIYFIMIIFEFVTSFIRANS